MPWTMSSENAWSDGPSWLRFVLQTGAMGFICWMFLQQSENSWKTSADDRKAVLDAQDKHLATTQAHDRELREQANDKIKENTAAVRQLESGVNKLVPAIESLTQEVRALKFARGE